MVSYLSEIEGWDSYIKGEYSSSIEKNNRSLGGQQPKTAGEDEDTESSFEVNMEKIMSRFQNFSQNMSASKEEEKNEEQEEEMFKEIPKQSEPTIHLEERELDSSYSDNNYWTTNYVGDKSIDDLLAEEGM